MSKIISNFFQRDIVSPFLFAYNSFKQTQTKLPGEHTMYGILFQVFYSTRHNAKMNVSVDKLFVFVHASTGIEACEKAIQLLDMDKVEVGGCVRMI